MTIPTTKLARYSLALVAVASAFLLKWWLVPLTGTGAPFVFLAAVMVTSLVAGTGPAVVALLLSLSFGGYMFVVATGYRFSQAVFQSLLFAIDGSVVIYLTFLMQQGRRAAQDAEARRRELLDLAPDAFFQANLDARFTDVNQAACRSLGYTRDELLGMTIFDVIPEGDAARLKAVRDQLLVPGRVERAEWLHKRKDGSLVPFEVSANILPGGRWQAFTRDISERKRIEDERQVFVSFLENSSDFIGIADPDGKPLYVNPAGRRMVGLPADYPIERTQMSEYYAPEQRAFAANFIVRGMLEQGRWEGETCFRHWQTEEPIPVSDAHFLIRDPKTHRTLGMGTITRDISVARRIAAEREELLERERLAREQAESAIERLQESEEALRRAVAARDQVLGIVAHDLRNPLMSIVHSVQLAERKPESEVLAKPLSIVARGAARMNQLIQGLLDVSSIEAGQLKIECEPVCAPDLVHGAVEMQTPLASSSSLVLHADVASDVGDVCGSRERLDQVFENLIGNAIKFTDAGGRITVGASSKGEDVLFWVTDSGRGISPDDLAHVFDRFWQVVPRAGRTGAGLGLAITKGLVEAQGGRIWVESVLGRGSTFFFTIPKAPVARRSAEDLSPGAAV
jgi:PAS domain S-box-containing protein